MHLAWSVVHLLASGAPALPSVPPAEPFPASPPSVDRSERVDASGWRWEHTLIVAGAGTWMLPYAPVLFEGTQSALNRPAAPATSLMVPLLGPWLYLGRGGTTQPNNERLLIVNGAVQLAGATALAVGLGLLLERLTGEPGNAGMFAG